MSQENPMAMAAKAKPTFVVNIQYTQNSSWQGTVTWVETNIQKHFRSALELIKLMDDAVQNENETKWN